MKYGKKPIVIEAVQWMGTQQSWEEILAMGEIPWEPGEMGTESFRIRTLEGEMTVRPGDYVIRGVQGEFYPCKPDIFEATYEAAEPPQGEKGGAE